MNPIRIVIRLACLTAALLAVTLLLSSHATHRADAGIPRIRLTNSQASADALAQAFVAALAASDRNAVERLRVDESEYRDLILPGSVKPGDLPQIMPPDKSAFYWRMLNTRSIYALGPIMKAHGGKKYRLKKVASPKVEQFAWYTAHRDPVLYLEGDDGTEVELKLGSMAEYDGHFKFISYWSD